MKAETTIIASSERELIYHYTTGKHLTEIIRTGALIVSQWEKENNVKPPALWLSKNPVWEPTATKLYESDGKIERLTKDKQHQLYGLVRFVLDFKKKALCSWGKYRFKSNTPYNMYRAMERSGLTCEANPREWYASFSNIPLSDCISCEKWDGQNWRLHDDLSQWKNPKEAPLLMNNRSLHNLNTKF